MEPVEQDLQRILDRELSKADTSLVMLNVQTGDGRTVFKGSAGACGPDVPFYIASISKIYTATLIMQLVDEGAIALDQRVQELLPHVDLSDIHVIDGVAHGPRVTVRQLLHQTSGLADYFESRLLGDLKKNRDQSYDLGDVLNWAKALSPVAAPGKDRSHYSDTNYQLLGAIVETVTNQSYNAALQDRICRPLGLTQTALCGCDRTPEAIPPVRFGDQPLDLRQALASMAADGGIVSTMDELAIFLRAFMSNQLFNPDNATIMQQWNRLYFPMQYGLGLMRFKLPCWMTLFQETPEFIGHSGACGSLAFHAPKEDLFLVGTFNQLGQGRRPFTGFLQKVVGTVARHGTVS